MDKAKVKRIAVSTVAVASVLLGAAAANAQDARLKSIVDEVNQATQIAQASQQRIDSTVDATSKLFVEYKGVLKTNAGLEAYNAQQKRVIKKQEEEVAKIKKSIGQIDEIKRQVIPLMEEMIENLEEFVNADVPFQKEKRLERIEMLREYMDDPNISDPERFRLILAEYNVEVQYGRTINAYEGQLDDGRTVNFVRTGRIGFYYQTKDGAETKAWNKETESWQDLDAEFTSSIKQLIRIAQKRAQQDIVVLPVAAPEGN